MEKKANWDDIPSLGLQLEQDASKKKTDNRAEVRLFSRDLLELFMMDCGVIYVQVAKDKKNVKKGIILDINQKGMGFQLAAHGLKKNDSILLGTLLGTRGFKTNAVVRWAKQDKVGVEYINPKPEDYHFLSELYGAKILNNT